jgi:diadenosine tetraphosphatase ApaH/serine/threonine PP2A family protein phosphatase
MKIAIISDVHANLEALEVALRDIEKQGAEKIHFLGDVVGYGCNPNECVDLINRHCEIKLLGNHDFAALGLESTTGFNQVAAASITWTQTELSEASREILADFDMKATFLDYLLVHSTPGKPENWNYILNKNQAIVEFDNFSETACFIGHSHLPIVYYREPDETVRSSSKQSLELAPENRYIINVGSIGQPRDNDPRASYLLLDTDRKRIKYRRIEYDIDKTQAKMRKAMLPEFLIERLSFGR